MTDIVVKFDADYQRKVIEITDNDTGTLDKFIFDRTKRAVVPASSVVVVKTSDLQLLYKSSCRRFKNIFFCWNMAKGGQIFKYAESERGCLQRVQCRCCLFEDHLAIDEVVYMSKFKFNSDFVDEESNNFLYLRPRYSKFCEEQRRMVIFAAVWPDEEGTETLLFNAETEEFEMSLCRCYVCKQKYDFLESLEFGAQQLSFARGHLDKFGRALLCLSIDWYDKFNGQMSVFCNAEGHIGRYLFDPKIKRFELVEPLKVRIFPIAIPDRLKTKKVVFDNELIMQYIWDCPSIGEKIYFAFNRGKMRKFLFSSAFMQFELVKCKCCQYNPKNIKPHQSREPSLGLYHSSSTNTPLLVLRTGAARVEKKIRIGDRFYKIAPSPIRNLKYERPEEIQSRVRHEKKLRHENPPLKCDEDGTEYFSISMDLMVDLTGRITPFNPIPENEKSAVFKPKILMDSDLSPDRMGYCDHLNTAVISARIHSLPRLPVTACGNFIFDVENTEMRQIHCCQPSFFRRFMVPSDVVSVAGKPSVTLKTNGAGRLVKEVYDFEKNASVVLEPKPVRLTFKWEKLPGDVPWDPKTAGIRELNGPDAPSEAGNFYTTYRPLIEHYWSLAHGAPVLENGVALSRPAVKPTDDADDGKSTATAIEPEEGDVESVHTAMEPSDAEDDEDEDAKSTATAIEPQEDIEDVESVSTASEPPDEDEERVAVNDYYPEDQIPEEHYINASDSYSDDSWSMGEDDTEDDDEW